jgi:hypothetical protein
VSGVSASAWVDTMAPGRRCSVRRQAGKKEEINKEGPETATRCTKKLSNAWSNVKENEWEGICVVKKKGRGGPRRK